MSDTLQRSSAPEHWLDRFVLAASALLLAGFMSLTGDTIPPLPDLTGLDPESRKEVFIAYLDPILERVNDEVARQRARLTELRRTTESHGRLSLHEARWLRELRDRYDVPRDVSDEEAMAILERRVDVVPRSLILVQAAKESGWGTSRFAMEGNNLFGQRCYREGCGLTPQSAQHSRFAVAAYASTLESVRAYVHNLNTHPPYRGFRVLRESLRARGERLSGLRLADALGEYSERAAAYVVEIKAMIRQNELEPAQTS